MDRTWRAGLLHNRLFSGSGIDWRKQGCIPVGCVTPARNRPWQRPPWTEAHLVKHPPGQRSSWLETPGQRFPGQRPSPQTETPRQRPTQTEATLDRDPPGQRPSPRQRPSPGRDPLGQRPLDRDPLDRDSLDRDPLVMCVTCGACCEQNHRQV